MTRDRSVDERISAWLFAEAPDQLPDRVLKATFERTRPTRQRRAFLGWRPFSMNRSLTRLAVGAAAIAIVAVGVALLPRSNSSVGAGPSPTPIVSPTLDPTIDETATLAPISLTGQVALVRAVDGNLDLYMMNLDRTGLVRLTEDPADDHAPAWAPDGRTLFFARGPAGGDESDIYALDIESGNEVRLTNDPGVEGEPRVSPDGTQIAFEVWPSAPGSYVMDPDGSNRRLVWTSPDDTYVGIGWNPDGTALYSIRNGAQIFRLDVATGAMSAPVAGGDENIALSPDGTTFAFQGDGRSPGGIYLMDVDGSNVRHLTGDWQQVGGISWSPDGQYLAFSLSDGWLYLVGADGRGLTRWTDSDRGFAWRPAP